MSKIYIKMMSDLALEHLKRNISEITNKIIANDTNDWIYKEFPKPVFVDKKYEIDDKKIGKKQLKKLLKIIKNFQKKQSKNIKN